MNRLLIALVAVGMICSASSCNLWRRVTGSQKKPAVTMDSTRIVIPDSAAVIPDTIAVQTDTARAAPAVDSQQLTLLQSWMPLWNAQTAYTTFNGRAKVDYEGGGESHELNANIRMERGKGIWISITALLGIEVARALITPDTIIAINRGQREVRIMPFADVTQLLPVQVDFATLQSLIIGDILPTGRQPNEFVDTGQLIVLSVVDSAFLQQVSLSREDSLLAAQTLTAASSMLFALYKDYMSVNGRRFSRIRELSMNENDAWHRINLEFTKVVFDEPVDMSISIPSKYERK